MPVSLPGTVFGYFEATALVREGRWMGVLDDKIVL